MNYSRSDKSSAKHRTIAVFFTVLFHLGLLGGLFYKSGTSSLPGVVKEWLNIQPDNKVPAKKDNV
jgi:hypothetical protein